jgi:hypothetical protein
MEIAQSTVLHESLIYDRVFSCFENAPMDNVVDFCARLPFEIQQVKQWRAEGTPWRREHAFAFFQHLSALPEFIAALSSSITEAWFELSGDRDGLDVMRAALPAAVPRGIPRLYERPTPTAHPHFSVTRDDKLSWIGDGAKLVSTGVSWPPEPPHANQNAHAYQKEDSSVRQSDSDSEVHAFFTTLLADPRLPILGPALFSKAGCGTNIEMHTTNGGSCEGSIIMTPDGGCSCENPKHPSLLASEELWRWRYGPLGAFTRMTDSTGHTHARSVRAALVTGHYHLFETWFKCEAFVGCRLRSSFANPVEHGSHGRQMVATQEAFWRPFLEVDGQRLEDPFLVVSFAMLKSASMHPQFDELNPILRLWMNWILGWELDLIILSNMLHVPWDVGFKNGANLDYFPLFSTRNNSALESAISKYPLLITHFHLQTFNPTSALRIFFAK